MGTLWSIRDVDLKEFIKFSLFNRSLASIVVTRVKSPYGVVYLRGYSVTRFVEKPLLNHCVNVGTYLLRRELVPLLKKNFHSKNIEVSVLQPLAAKRELSAYRFNGFWKSTDNAKDY